MVTISRFGIPASVFQGAVNATRRMITAMVRRLVDRHQAQRLLDMDDRMLSDIGLTRGDVRAALWAPGPMAPTARLKGLAVQRRAAMKNSMASNAGRGGRKPGRMGHLEDA